MKTRDLIRELPAMFQTIREQAHDTMDEEGATAADAYITALEAETLGRLRTYAKVEATARKEIANAIKEG